MKQGRSSTTKVSTTRPNVCLTSVRWSAQPGRKDTALDRELTSDALHDLEVTCFLGVGVRRTRRDVSYPIDSTPEIEVRCEWKK